MTKKSNYVQTGIFVSLGILLFGLTFYFLSRDENIFSKKSLIHSYFNNTQGLMFGSTVSFSGIIIGNVKAIEYDNNKKSLRVDYSIRNSYLPFIKKDSIAQLKTQGALGDRFIFLSRGSSKSTSIHPGGELLTKPSDDIFAKVQEKVNNIPNLSGVFKNLEKLIAFLNSEDGLKGATKELQFTLKELRTTLASINSKNYAQNSLKQLNSILTKINLSQGTLGKIISDPNLYNKMSNFLGEKESTSSYLKSLGRKSIEKTEEK